MWEKLHLSCKKEHVSAFAQCPSLTVCQGFGGALASVSNSWEPPILCLESTMFDSVDIHFYLPFRAAARPLQSHYLKLHSSSSPYQTTSSAQRHAGTSSQVWCSNNSTVQAWLRKQQQTIRCASPPSIVKHNKQQQKRAPTILNNKLVTEAISMNTAKEGKACCSRRLVGTLWMLTALAVLYK